MTQTHNFDPVYDKKSRVLILGSFPSVKSREIAFYYGHPQNRFWKVLGSVFNEEVPKDIEGKKSFLLKHHIALWDVIKSCDIVGSSDSKISNVVINDLNLIFQEANIEKVFINGTKAYELYMKYGYEKYKKEAIKLPSTSPANAVYSLDKLKEKWEIIKTSE